MAQSTFHFGIGMLCATVFTLKPVIRQWRTKLAQRTENAIPPTLSSAIASWCLWSYAIGTWAVIPAVARRLTGVDPTHPIWNLFIAYPLIDRLPLPSIIVGELLMGSILGSQYLTILAAIYILQHKN